MTPGPDRRVAALPAPRSLRGACSANKRETTQNGLARRHQAKQPLPNFVIHLSPTTEVTSMLKSGWPLAALLTFGLGALPRDVDVENG